MKETTLIWSGTFLGLTLSQIDSLVSIFVLLLTAGFTLDRWVRFRKNKKKNDN